MEKLTNKIAALPPDANYFSLEFFPPKTQMVGCPALKSCSTTGRMGSEEDVSCMLMMTCVGFRQSSSPVRAHGTSAATIVRYSHMGCRREYGKEIFGVGGGVPATVAVNDMLAFDLHEHESGTG